MDNHGWIHPGITDTGEGGPPEMVAGKALESSQRHFQTGGRSCCVICMLAN